MWKKIGCVLVTLCLIVGMIGGLTQFLRPDVTRSRFSPYFQKDGQEYDVLFLGSSHGVMANLPMELWNQYGLTSYNLGQYGQTLAMDYWMLKNALNFHTPRVVVLDIYQMVLNHKFYEGHLYSVVNSLCAIPWSRDKLDAINDVMPENMRINAIFPFAAYHSRWQDVDKTFFEEPEPNYERGAEAGKDLIDMVRYDGVFVESDPDEYTVVTGNPADYLRKSIELCQQNGIQVLLTSIPSCYDWEQVRLTLNYACVIADEYGVPLYDGIARKTVDERIDMYDFGHVNASGGKKWTSALGAYMVEQFGLASHKGEAGFEGWDADFAAYNAQKLKRLQTHTLMKNVLMLCADRNISISLRVRGSSGFLNDEQIAALVENLAPGEELPGLAEAIRTGGDYSLTAFRGQTVTEDTLPPQDPSIALEITATDALNPQNTQTLRFRPGAEKAE